MHLVRLPPELVHEVLVWAVLQRGVKRAFRMRLVCRWFADKAVLDAVLASGILDTLPRHGFEPKERIWRRRPRNPQDGRLVWRRYLAYLATPRTNAPPPSRWLRRARVLAETLVEDLRRRRLTDALDAGDGVGEAPAGATSEVQSCLVELGALILRQQDNRSDWYEAWPEGCKLWVLRDRGPEANDNDDASSRGFVHDLLCAALYAGDSELASELLDRHQLEVCSKRNGAGATDTVLCELRPLVAAAMGGHVAAASAILCTARDASEDWHFRAEMLREAAASNRDRLVEFLMTPPPPATTAAAATGQDHWPGTGVADRCGDDEHDDLVDTYQLARDLGLNFQSLELIVHVAVFKRFFPLVKSRLQVLATLRTRLDITKFVAHEDSIAWLPTADIIPWLWDRLGNAAREGCLGLTEYILDEIDRLPPHDRPDIPRSVLPAPRFYPRERSRTWAIGGGLSAAARRGDTELVKLLLPREESLNHYDLENAVRGGVRSGVVSVAQLTLEAFHRRQLPIDTARLHQDMRGTLRGAVLAENEEMVRMLLLEHGDLFDAQGRDDAAQIAWDMGCESMVDLLAQLGTACPMGPMHPWSKMELGLPLPPASPPSRLVVGTPSCGYRPKLRRRR